MGVVSIVIPIYNTEKYLRRCIESLLIQTYSNIEVWLIDDGSTDNSGDICDEYATKDKRVRVYHKVNGGEASARNAGLERATGDYIMFCDSDDEYLQDAVEKLLKGILESDLAVGAYLEISSDRTRYAAINQKNCSLSEMIIRIFTDSSPYGTAYIMSTVNGKLFRLSILREQTITFNESFVVGNDSLFMWEYLPYCTNIVDIFRAVYVYYKYDTTERIQGMAWLYPDQYKLIVCRMHTLLSCAEISSKIRSRILVDQFDILIKSLVIAVAYEEYFAGGIYNEINKLLKSHLIYEAAKSYKRTRITDSRLIPFFFRYRLVYLLTVALRVRAKRYLAANVKSDRVRLLAPELDEKR